MKIKPYIKKYIKDYAKQRHTDQNSTVQLISAQTLSDEDIQSLVERIPDLRGKKIKKTVDDSLLAGVIIKKSSKMLDLSLRSQLNQFRKVFKGL